MTLNVGQTAPSGALSLQVIRRKPTNRELTLPEIRHHAFPQRGLRAEINAWRRRNRPNIIRGLQTILPARMFGIPHFYGALWLQVIRANGEIDDLGLASLRLVTTTGVKFICDDFNASAQDVSNMKFHAIGTGTNAEAAADTALQTEITTAYNPDNTRATGSQASATVSANATYTTVGTNTVDATVAATEHGILSQAATGGGTLLDRSVFTVVNLASGDSLQSTYVLTVNSGG